MRYLTLGELIELHRRIIEQSGVPKESAILRLAAGKLERIPFTEWVVRHVAHIEAADG